MLDNRVLAEFREIGTPESFSLNLLLISTGVASLIFIVLYKYLGMYWFGALYLTYALQCLGLIFSVDAYLRQNKFNRFVKRNKPPKIRKMLTKGRLSEAREELREHFAAENQQSILSEIMDMLLDESEFFLLNIFKYFLFLLGAIIFLPYVFVRNSAERFLGALSSGQSSAGSYLNYLISVFLLGFIIFGVSLSFWLGFWKLWEAWD